LRDLRSSVPRGPHGNEVRGSARSWHENSKEMVIVALRTERRALDSQYPPRGPAKDDAGVSFGGSDRRLLRSAAWREQNAVSSLTVTQVPALANVFRRCSCSADRS
jgi:hypothetical protein